ncbi:ribonuclease R [Ascodesmis nigricans]|uniref:Chromosome disjunction protein 3 n=1 Tax=Ascodesmis nigricans TaxID=341454 RepID=A0A4S2N267_9PEZI|nr:ribonuclease R [Ascodesmis nigricans]
MTSLKRAIVDTSTDSGLANKVFLRSSRGKCVKVVREIYLRQDIPCSSHLCVPCTADAVPDANGRVKPFILSATPPKTSAYPNGHYLVPDTNIFLYCMDVMEHKSAFHDVVVLQTVLDELRNRSLPLYNRLRGLTNSEDKRFYVFHNDFRKETYVKRYPGESINDRNDRAIRAACRWYTSHLQEAVAGSKTKVPMIVMLSDDKANLNLARNDGIECTNIRDYVKGFDNADELLDMISASLEDQEARAGRGDMLYPEYYSMSKMQTGIRSGTMHQGTFNVSPYNFLEGTIHVPAFDRPLIVLGRENINRAVTGDLVVVELLPKDQWKQPSSKIVEEEALGKNDNAETEGPEVIETEQERRALIDEAKRSQQGSAEGRPQPTAKVVGIIKRNWRYYVGHIDPSSVAKSKGRGQQTVFLLPMDKRIPKIRIRTRQASEITGKRIVVSIDTWDRTSRYPVGHYVRSLGELETKGAETEALLLEYDVQYRPFPKAVLDCLPREGHDWVVPPMDDPRWKGRVDYRDKLICSIDPPGCQDIDDALHATLLPNGNYEVGVHIADVTHFVKPNTPMDDEATARGTTVYLVDKRIDMLPMLLGTDLCSLKPYVERFAFSTIWEITPDADIISVKFNKSAIKSREAFSYEQAQLRIDDKSQQDELTQGMRILLQLSKKLKQKRMDAGALNLASPEVRIEADSETSDPIDVKTKQLLETNSLVEEFMLLANISVATKIYDAFPQTAMLRRHGAPPATNFEDLQKQLQVRKGLSLRVDSSKALADSLDECVDSKEPFFNTLVRILATRCMLSAEYFCSGTQAYPEFRHYGLASEIYTHFTSPIRRYADVVAHRQLAAAIDYEPLHPMFHSKSKLEAICKNINVRHRNAQFAGRASVEYYVGQALKARGMAQEEAFVMKVFSNGIVVFVPRFGIEGVVKVGEMMGVQNGEKAELDEEKFVLSVGERRLGLFEKVKVEVKDELEEASGKRKIAIKLLD